ncbi:MAG TPA: OmpH family outer membrane protein [Spirochaetales bacterium]|nr:OmpH family outer membrane protein [Spirochaetales bacterium]
MLSRRKILKRVNRIILLSALLFLVSAILFSEQLTRIGIIDIEKVYSIYFRESRTVMDLQEKQNAILREIQRIDDQILTLENRKLEAEMRGDQESALKLDREIFDRKQYLEDYKRIKMQQLKKLAENLYQSDEFLDELLEAINFVAESEGFSIILNNSKQFKQFFFYYTKEVDITDKVIQELMSRAGRNTNQ